MRSVKSVPPGSPSMGRMTPLSPRQMGRLSAKMALRKEALLEEIRQVLEEKGKEHYADIIGGVGDEGDQALATVVADIANAEVSRDILEVRDIAAAEARIAAGTYGVCIDCGAEIDYARLDAYPSCKRCLRCQDLREKTRAGRPHPTL